MAAPPPPGHLRRTTGLAADEAAAGRTADPDGDLTVTVERRRDGPLLRVTGELDVYGAPLVAAMVEHAAADGFPVHVDLSGVSFVDSHGLAPLLRSGVLIRWASAPVRRLLRLLGLPYPESVRPLLLAHG